MFFLLRAAFWLSLVILLIPADPTEVPKSDGARSVSTFEAIGAAHSTYEDHKGFCGRNPGACETGKAALDGFGAKARTGARWVYEQLDGKDGATTGSTPRPAGDRAVATPLPTPRPLS